MQWIYVTASFFVKGGQYYAVSRNYRTDENG